MADEFSAAAKSRRVRLLQILIPQRGEVSRFRVSRMDDDAVAEVQLAAGLERYSARLRFVAGEGAYTERIRGEQSVGANVPACPAGIFRLIVSRDPQLLALYLA